MVDSVSSLLEATIPDCLWHYTSIRGFKGISESEGIFATDLRFLNDTEEFLHARKILVSIAEELIDEKPITDLLRKAFKETIEMAFESGPLHSEYLQVFVASFSEAEDQLSQWRGYSGNTNGMSLGLDLRSVRPSKDKRAMVVFAPCLYDDEEKRHLLRNIAQSFIDKLSRAMNAAYKAGYKQGAKERQDSEGPIGEEGTEVIMERVWKEDPAGPDLEHEMANCRTSMFLELLRVAALMKHSSFKEEREWRLVVSVSKGWHGNPKPVMYREGATSLIPYISYPLKQLGGSHLPLNKVIVGPGSDQYAVDVASKFLAQLGMTPEVRNSIAPFRPS